jgi:hypothetical protein
MPESPEDIQRAMRDMYAEAARNNAAMRVQKQPPGPEVVTVSTFRPDVGQLQGAALWRWREFVRGWANRCGRPSLAVADHATDPTWVIHEIAAAFEGDEPPAVRVQLGQAQKHAIWLAMRPAAMRARAEDDPSEPVMRRLIAEWESYARIDPATAETRIGHPPDGETAASGMRRLLG